MPPSADSALPVLVLCMKWGTLYGAGDVNRLARAVRRHLSRPHRFVCLTDDARDLVPGVEALPLPALDLPAGSGDTRWRKLALFARDLHGLQGTALFLDLDLVVTGSLDAFFDHPAPGVLIQRDDDLFRPKPLRRLRPLRDARLRRMGNSSVFRFRIGAHPDVLEAYLADPAGAERIHGIEQGLLSAVLDRQGLLDFWPRGWCVSFKNDCVPRFPRSFWTDPVLPPGARIVLFAGRPKLPEVLAGRGGRWYRRIGPAPWLRAALDEGEPDRP
ncbi:hypothetical protein [Rubellimicrobium sp. CFH 75288]|uniref:hypothetical protein n=1 Tax=Rubellimicrobium sp. CFH 75288 TaxID=2697034 RepID=UPI00352AD2AC